MASLYPADDGSLYPAPDGLYPGDQGVTVGVAEDTPHGQVILYLPDPMDVPSYAAVMHPSTTVVPGSDVYPGMKAPPPHPDYWGRWEIARLPGAGTPASAIVEAHSIAHLPLTMRLFVDRRPYGGPATYYCRARVSAEPDRYSDWSLVGSLTPSVPLRSQLLSPQLALELYGGTNPQLPDNATSSVETAAPYRFAATGDADLEFTFDYRASITPLVSATDSLRVGFRFYDQTGRIVADEYQDYALVETGSSGPQSGAGRRTIIAFPPSGTYSYGFYFQYRTPQNDLGRVRIENVEHYRHDVERDSYWEYIQLPNQENLHPDQRKDEVDQTAFTYEGVGWSALSAAPPGAAASSPYKESNSADDDILFLTTGPWIDILLYGSAVNTHLEISRLIDSTVEQTEQDGSDLWGIVEDAATFDSTKYFGPNILTSAWTTKPSSDNLKQNGISYFPPDNTTYPPLTVNTAGDTWTSAAEHTGEGASNTFVGITFKAGRKYTATLNLSLAPGATASNVSLQVLFGVEARYPGGSTGLSWDYYVDYVQSAPTLLTTGTHTVSVEWTPHTDTDQVFLAVVNVGAAYADYTVGQFQWTAVTVRELLGITIPPTTNFAPVRIQIPGLFSPRNATAYRVKLLDGVLRPYGLQREFGNYIDLVLDFQTVLRSLGDLRNTSFGELEFKGGEPPLVRHYTRRGTDHSTLAGGLDLRFGKNITSRRRSSDVTNLANRVIVIGYGSDRTQLVQEARSLIDVQQRLPSDPDYRKDALGRTPDNPDWDRETGGTSEDIFGPRYGVYRDSNINTRYQAVEQAQGIVEASAWPAETYEINIVDLNELPAQLEPGDLVLIRYGGRDLLRRIIEITYSLDKPRELGLTLGENRDELSTRFERLSRDVETVRSFISDSGTALPASSLG